MWRNEDQPELLKHKFKDLQYPPRIILDVSYDESSTASRMIKFALHCSGVQETDKKITLQAKSSWFNNIHSSKCVK